MCSPHLFVHKREQKPQGTQRRVGTQTRLSTGAGDRKLAPGGEALVWAGLGLPFKPLKSLHFCYFFLMHFSCSFVFLFLKK